MQSGYPPSGYPGGGHPPPRFPQHGAPPGPPQHGGPPPPFHHSKGGKGGGYDNRPFMDNRQSGPPMMGRTEMMMSPPPLIGAVDQTAHLDHIGKQRTRDIRPGTELRLVVGDTEEVYLKSHSKIPDTFATAEVFGEELVLGHEYRLAKGSQLAVFTWHGCTIEMRGTPTVEYDASNASMTEYVNAAGIIEQKRTRAEDLGTAAPRVLVTGGASSGKSTFALFLVNFALRKSRRPIYVELDPRCSNGTPQLPSLPGCVCAVAVDQTSYEFGQEPIPPHRLVFKKEPKTESGETPNAGIPVASESLNYPMGRSLWYFFGHLDWKDAPLVYWKTIGQLSCMVDGKEELINNAASAVPAANRKDNAYKSGVIVNAPRDPSPELLDEIIRLYAIDTVIVLDDQPTYSGLCRRFKIKTAAPPTSGHGSNALAFLDDEEDDEEEEGGEGNPRRALDVAHLSKAGGVITNADEALRKIRDRRISTYFYGPDKELNSHTLSVPLKDLILVRVEAVTSGSDKWRDRFRVVPFSENPILLRHALLAAVIAPSREDVVLASMYAMVWVRDVTDADDPASTQLHLLCPSPGPLLSNYLVAGDLSKLKYFEV